MTGLDWVRDSLLPILWIILQSLQCTLFLSFKCVILELPDLWLSENVTMISLTVRENQVINFLCNYIAHKGLDFLVQLGKSWWHSQGVPHLNERNSVQCNDWYMIHRIGSRESLTQSKPVTCYITVMLQRESPWIFMWLKL